MFEIDIKSVFVHSAYAVDSKGMKAAYIGDIESHYNIMYGMRGSDYVYFVTISGLYKNGTPFKNKEIRSSAKGYDSLVSATT